MDRVLTDEERIEGYQKLKDSLLPNQWNKYMRFLGLSENDLQPLIENRDKFQMLVHWQQNMGILTQRLIDLLNNVAQEAIDMRRNQSLDALFRTKLAQNRDKAWLLYGSLSNYQLDFWNDNIVKTKLILTDAVIDQIRGAAYKDAEEQKYQHLLSWIQKKGLESTTQIAEELRHLEIVVPIEFGTFDLM